jgi:quercetin dioxygenase-like cupin family protein
MPTYNWTEIPREQMNSLVIRQVIHGERITIARLTLAKGAFVPVHSHVNEQISTVESGRLEFVLNGQRVVIGAGQTLVIPPNVPHSAEALEDSVAIDVFSPVREDWIRGDDAYLRK